MHATALGLCRGASAEHSSILASASSSTSTVFEKYSPPETMRLPTASISPSDETGEAGSAASASSTWPSTSSTAKPATSTSRFASPNVSLRRASGVPRRSPSAFMRQSLPSVSTSCDLSELLPALTTSTFMGWTSSLIWRVSGAGRCGCHPCVGGAPRRAHAKIVLDCALTSRNASHERILLGLQATRARSRACRTTRLLGGDAAHDRVACSKVREGLRERGRPLGARVVRQVCRSGVHRLQRAAVPGQGRGGPASRGRCPSWPTR